VAESVDRILAVIDAGLQSTSELMVDEGDDRSACVRCQRADRAEGSDWCGPCRAFLLGDTDDDPAVHAQQHVVVYVSVTEEQAFAVVFDALVRQMRLNDEQVQAVRDLAVAVGRSLTEMAEAFAAALKPSLADAIRQLAEFDAPPTPVRYVCPRHGPQARTFCRRCVVRQPARFNAR